MTSFYKEEEGVHSKLIQKWRSIRNQVLSMGGPSKEDLAELADLGRESCREIAKLAAATGRILQASVPNPQEIEGLLTEDVREELYGYRRDADGEKILVGGLILRGAADKYVRRTIAMMKTIRDQGPIAKYELARKLSVDPRTLSKMVQVAVEMNLVDYERSRYRDRGPVKERHVLTVADKGRRFLDLFGAELQEEVRLTKEGLAVLEIIDGGLAYDL